MGGEGKRNGDLAATAPLLDSTCAGWATEGRGFSPAFRQLPKSVPARWGVRGSLTYCLTVLFDILFDALDK